MFTAKVVILCLSFVLLSCSSKNIHPSAESSTQKIAPLELLKVDHLGFNDARPRFKKIFCEVLDHHGSGLPDFQSCDNALRTVGPKIEASQEPVDISTTDKSFIIGLVPGIAWQCVRNWLNNDNSAPRHLLTQGFDVRLFEVDGLSSSKNNAQQIYHHVMSLPEQDSQRPLILVGYSKGAADTLYALANYPELRKRVAAVVSVAGAIGGSPLANNAKQSHLNLLTYIPMSACDSGDEKALESLYTETRKQWLADHPLPENIHYYSVIAYPESDRISLGLKSSYHKLSDVDSRNDGQLIFYHQLIPKSSLLAFVNADHWAMSIPVARQIFLNRISFANKNEYPREILLEAILRYVEEDLLNTKNKTNK